MDDFVVPSLKDSRFEWASRLTNILTPHIIDGIVSIFEDSCKMCNETNEKEKYLMTFQNLLSRIPKWNENMIDVETKRIVEKCQCNYLEDLITCVHIIQLKILSAIRVCSKQKKIEINVPKLNTFIHKVYISVARKFYKNAYLFEINIQKLQKQKNMTEIEKHVEECILNAIRESIPIEGILKAYMAESFEDEYKEEVKEVKEEVILPSEIQQEPSFQQEPIVSSIINNEVQPASFSSDSSIEIPRLEPYSENTEISSLFSNNDKQRVSFNESTKFDNEIKIHDNNESISLDFESLDNPSMSLNNDLILDDVEVLY